MTSDFADQDVFNEEIYQCTGGELSGNNDFDGSCTEGDFYLEVCYLANQNTCGEECLTVTATDDLYVNGIATPDSFYDLDICFDLMEDNDPVDIIEENFNAINPQYTSRACKINS